MDSLSVSTNDGIAEVTIRRGKVNALSEPSVKELGIAFRDLAQTTGVRSVILTGQGPFFSFGFDIPEFLSYSKESFTRFLSSFTTLYTDLFTYPKPLIAALNGHTIAGGCMIALPADYRIMVSGKAKISLNEITFGASVFAGSVAMLTFLLGGRHARDVLYEGTMFTAEQALRFGLIDQISTDGQLMRDARDVARRLGRQGSGRLSQHQKAIANARGTSRWPPERSSPSRSSSTSVIGRHVGEAPSDHDSWMMIAEVARAHPARRRRPEIRTTPAARPGTG